MKQFDTSVQELKNKVLSDVARCAFEGRLETDLIKAPERLIPGPKAMTRCCIYKERAIITERVHMALGGNRENPNIVEVMPIACDECPVSQISVTAACRGCRAHRCANACPKDAITIVDHQAVIDKNKCISCGKCLAACPYNAIIKQQRPCERACKLGAIKMGEDEKATINNDKCITCGQCVYQCPFGAIMDKSYIVDVIKALQNSNDNKDYEVYAIVAPAIATQFGAEVGQVVSGLKQLGFFTVI
ncbi:MAG: 4Fe-4S binding protein, partial [Oscillospiraceae bacterium]